MSTRGSRLEARNARDVVAAREGRVKAWEMRCATRRARDGATRGLTATIGRRQVGRGRDARGTDGEDEDDVSQVDAGRGRERGGRGVAPARARGVRVRVRGGGRGRGRRRRRRVTRGREDARRRSGARSNARAIRARGGVRARVVEPFDRRALSGGGRRDSDSWDVCFFSTTFVCPPREDGAARRLWRSRARRARRRR